MVSLIRVVGIEASNAWSPDVSGTYEPVRAVGVEVLLEKYHGTASHLRAASYTRLAGMPVMQR